MADSDDSMMVVGDSMGTIHFVNIHSNEIIYSQIIAPPQVQDSPITFLELRSSGFYLLILTFRNLMDLLVVLSNGIVVRISKIPNLSDASNLKEKFESVNY